MSDENLGAYQVDYVTADIQNLDSAGAEPYSTWVDQSGIDNPDAVTVIGQEEDAQVLIPDHMNDQFHVVDHTGSDVSNDTDIGEVRVRIEGRR